MKVYTVCKYTDYRKEVTFTVLKVYTDRQRAIDQVTDLATRDFMKSSNYPLIKEIDERIRELEESGVDVSDEVADLEMEKRDLGAMSILYPENDDWTGDGTPEYVYPSNVFVDAGYGTRRYCAFETELE